MKMYIVEEAPEYENSVNLKAFKTRKGAEDYIEYLKNDKKEKMKKFGKCNRCKYRCYQKLDKIGKTPKCYKQSEPVKHPKFLDGFFGASALAMNAEPLSNNDFAKYLKFDPVKPVFKVVTEVVCDNCNQYNYPIDTYSLCISEVEMGGEE